MKTIDEQNEAGVIVAICILLCAVLLLIAWIFPAEAQEVVPADEAIYCILGEARGEGFDGMVAVAEAIRNRGTLRGVYGCGARFTEPKWVWDLGRKAWAESEHTNTVRGATHWGGVGIDGKWIARMEKTMTFVVQINNQRFYR